MTDAAEYLSQEENRAGAKLSAVTDQAKRTHVKLSPIQTHFNELDFETL